jgi:hypothetical protein
MRSDLHHRSVTRRTTEIKRVPQSEVGDDETDTPVAELAHFHRGLAGAAGRLPEAFRPWRPNRRR